MAAPTKTSEVLVPFVDLRPSHAPLKERILAAVADLIDRGDFVNGAAVAAFEVRLAAYCGRRVAVGVASGLDALRLALLASGVEAGASVAVPAATFAATFEAVVQTGATPVVVDVTEADYCIDVDAIPSTECTHVMPVHLYGQLCDMVALGTTAAARGITIIEDACQAHGARRDGVSPGDRALAAAFSFYPAKNLGAMGDAGAIVTDDEDLAARVRALREHGETTKYHHDRIGFTARLDTVQAIVLDEKLDLLDEWNRQRRDAARYYSDRLGKVASLRVPPVARGSEPVWHLYVIRTAAPDDLGAFLRARGVQTGRHYPVPPHLAPAYRALGHAPGDFPVAEALSREGLSLPIYPGITEEHLDRVCRGIEKYVAAAA